VARVHGLTTRIDPTAGEQREHGLVMTIFYFRPGLFQLASSHRLK
jgi:hypothetical protein